MIGERIFFIVLIFSLFGVIVGYFTKLTLGAMQNYSLLKDSKKISEKLFISIHLIIPIRFKKIDFIK